jgi:hypothetical protein
MEYQLLRLGLELKNKFYWGKREKIQIRELLEKLKTKRKSKAINFSSMNFHNLFDQNFDLNFNKWPTLR